MPVVLGVPGNSAEIAIGYAEDARLAGADAVVAMPPYIRAAAVPDLITYFRGVAEAAAVPVFIQTYHRYPATALSVDVIAELAASVDGVDYVKEETLPAGQRISQLLAVAGASLQGVMGGFAGQFVIDEYLRAARAARCPPARSLDVHVATWRALEAGNLEVARDLHTRPSRCSTSSTCTVPRSTRRSCASVASSPAVPCETRALRASMLAIAMSST